MNVRWRMGRARLLALCVLLAVVVMVPAHAFGELVAEERLTFDSTPEWAPSVTGDRVAWRTTFTTYETGVFTWTAGGAVQQIWRGTDIGSGTNVQTSGDRTVWAVKAPVSMRYTIYSHTPAEGVRTVVSGLQYQPMLVALSGGAAYSGCVVGATTKRTPGTRQVA